MPELAGRPSAEPDLIFTPDRLAEMLPACDYVVLALPHTPATYHFIDEAALRHEANRIARQMMEASVELVRHNHGNWIALQVRTDNAIAHTLYQKLGFVDTGELVTFERRQLDPGVGRASPHPGGHNAQGQGHVP